MNTELTPALRLAARLHAVAEHLTRHPHLAPVNVISDKLQLQWQAEPAAALLAWTESLTDVSVRVRNIDGKAFVDVTGTATVGTATVWTTMPLFWPAADDASCPIDLDVLRAQSQADRPVYQDGGAS